MTLVNATTVSVQEKSRSVRSKNRKMTTIWDGVFFKLRVYFDGIVSRKKVFLESSYLIERHNDVVV